MSQNRGGISVGKSFFKDRVGTTGHIMNRLKNQYVSPLEDLRQWPTHPLDQMFPLGYRPYARTRTHAAIEQVDHWVLTFERRVHEGWVSD